MPNQRRTAALLAISCLVMLAGCSSGDEAVAPAGSVAPTTAVASVVPQIDAICADWKAQLEARGRLDVDGFDPQNPDPALLPQVGAYFAGARPIARASIDQIAALDVPADEQAAVDRLVAAMEAEEANAIRQVEAANAGDVDGFVPTVAETDAVNQEVTAAGEALGADSCGF